MLAKTNGRTKNDAIRAFFAPFTGWGFPVLEIDPEKSPQISIFEKQNNLPPIAFRWIMK